MNVVARYLEALPRPLDPLRSIKLKLGLLVVVSGLAGLAYFWYKIGRIPPTTSVIAIGLALLTTQILAHGMTRPLREMTAAARGMARGDYTRRVRATSRDEVGELALAFNHMAADLAAADRHRREMIANVSHELRTPISALQAVLENVVDGVSTPDPTTMRTALAQTERLGRLVTELLDLSRIDAGAHRLDLAAFDVAGLLAEAIAETRMAAAAAGRGVSFTCVVQPEGAVATGDRERLRQVLMNLLDNAARHSPIGGEVRITARTDPAGLAIEVGDDGPGIPYEERELVFQRFTRGERASGGGTGLGLSIARWVVDLHGGAIAVVDPAPYVHNGSSPGCRIRVTLPG